MMLFIDGIYQGVTCTNLMYWKQDYESAFEELTDMVANGWVLEHVWLADGPSRVELPVSAFDGESLREPIQQLQQQWRDLLQDKPVPIAGPSNQRLIDWHHQLITYYQRQLTLLNTMILCLEKGITNVAAKQRNPDLRLRVIRQYDFLLTTQKRLLKQTEGNHQRALNRLERLLKS